MNSDFKELLSLFNAYNVRYLIVGGVAFIFHAEPRYTKDLDLWISVDLQNAEAVYSSLRKFGAPLAGISVEDFSKPELVYQMGRPPNRVDILMSIAGIDFDAAWGRRVETEIDGIQVWFLSKEDLLVNKQSVGRPQDLLDVQTLLLPTRSPEEFQSGSRAKDELDR